MATISIRDAKRCLTALAWRVEQGEAIVITRNGRPIIDLVPHSQKLGARLDATDAFKRKHGVERVVAFVADDFDAPLPQDFLMAPSG
jgi:prevent-host-death family protein